MSARYKIPDEPTIIELDGPPMAYFNIPLDYWATPNGEIEPEGHPEATRLSQTITYINFHVRDNACVQTIIERVQARLKELGGGYIWWRRRPDYATDRTMYLRLGTTPQLPAAWWQSLSTDVGNGDLGKNIPGLPGG